MTRYFLQEIIPNTQETLDSVKGDMQPVTMIVERRTNFRRENQTKVKLFPPSFDITTLKKGQEVRFQRTL